MGSAPWISLQHRSASDLGVQIWVGPSIGAFCELGEKAFHPLRTRRRQASNKPKSAGDVYSGIPHPYLRRWATAIHGYLHLHLGVPGSRMPVQPPDTRTSGSLPRARPRFDKSALRTACETTCEGYITLNPKVNMRRTHSGPCSMRASECRCAVRCRAELAHARALRPGMRGL